MARKPLDQLSPAYRRRIERAEAQGKTRQQARGHRAQEHVHRREREKEELGLTREQMRAIHRWCDRYPNERRDSDDVIAEAIDQGGYDWFVNYRDVWNAARRAYLRSQVEGSYASKGEGYLQMLAELGRVPELSWMYYH